MTVTRMMFGSEQVQVEEEQLAFTGTDLLADFGDILGLFIGFNFIIIVDGKTTLEKIFIKCKS